MAYTIGKIGARIGLSLRIAQERRSKSQYAVHCCKSDA